MKRVDFKIFSKAYLQTGLKGGSVDMLQSKIGPKLDGQRILKLSNFVLFWRKTARTRKYAYSQIFSTIFVLKTLNPHVFHAHAFHLNFFYFFYFH
jgi:hypothetical protein